MDEQSHHIDRLFKKAVEQHVELPSSKVWENLEKNLQKRTVSSIYKKYKKWKWVAAALFIFSMALGMYALHLNLKYKKVSERKGDIETGNNTKRSGYSASIQRKQGDQKIVDNLQGLINEKQKPASSITKSSKIRKSSSLAGNKASASDKTDDVGVGPFQTNFIKRKRRSKTDRFVNPTEFQNKIETIGRKQLPGNSIKALHTNMSGNVSTSKSISTPSFPSTAKEASSEDFNKGNVNASIVSKNIDRSISAVQVPADILNNQSAIIPFLVNNTKAERVKAIGKSKVGPFSINLNRGKFTGSVYYSQNFVSTKVQPNNPDFREDHYLQIKSHEKMRAADVVGLSLVRNIGKRLGIETGVSLHTFITDINAKPLVARKDKNGKVNYRISSSSGYAYYLVKNRPTPALADTIRTISSTSTVKYISIPIGLQYHFYIGRKFLISPAIALSTNLVTKGKITTIQSLEHTYSNDIEGLKSHNFDGSLRLNISYYLNKRFGISLIPSTSLGLSDATEIRPVITRRNALGIAAGLNYSFW
jgi:hypothetical protein